MSGQHLIGNRSTAGTDGGGGAYIYRSSGKITGSKIIGNSSTDDGGGHGGGIAANNGGKLTIKGTAFTGNTAGSVGGALATLNDAALDIAGGIYDGNRGASGGAIDTTGAGTTTIASTTMVFANIAPVFPDKN